ncbi:MAG TPA: hypothetical protein VGM24_01000 [Puia sp.]
MAERDISIKSLLEKSQDYLETKIEIARLKTIDKSSDLVSSVIVLISVILMALLFFLFISIGVALYLGTLVGSAHAGFFIVGGAYGIVLLLLYAFREKWVKAPVANLIIKKLLK